MTKHPHAAKGEMQSHKVQRRSAGIAIKAECEDIAARRIRDVAEAAKSFGINF